MPDERERRVRGARDLLTGLRGARSGSPVRRAERLDTPVDLRRPLLGRGYDPERLGRVSERVARFLGTGKFIVYMTVFVGLWITWNTVLPKPYAFDPRSLNYTLLTLILSLQASYAAPLILLAQNRQDDRDRVNLDSDRRNDAQVRADLDFLSREVASLRIAVGDVATRDYVRSEVRQLTDTLTELLGLDEAAQAAQADSARRAAKKADKAEKARLERTASRAALVAARAAAAAIAESSRHGPPVDHAGPAVDGGPADDGGPAGSGDPPRDEPDGHRENRDSHDSHDDDNRNVVGADDEDGDGAGRDRRVLGGRR